MSFKSIMSKKLQWGTCCCDEVEFGVKRKQSQSISILVIFMHMKVSLKLEPTKILRNYSK